MPVFAASTPMSSKTASSCAVTNSGGNSWIAVTPTVFCAVNATIALIPWQPAAANAFRSAWMPAPPPESDDAIVNARGINSTPFAGMTPDQVRRVCSQPAAQGTPVDMILATLSQGLSLGDGRAGQLASGARMA